MLKMDEVPGEPEDLRINEIPDELSSATKEALGDEANNCFKRLNAYRVRYRNLPGIFPITGSVIDAIKATVKAQRAVDSYRSVSDAKLLVRSYVSEMKEKRDSAKNIAILMKSYLEAFTPEMIAETAKSLRAAGNETDAKNFVVSCVREMKENGAHPQEYAIVIKSYPEAFSKKGVKA